MCGASILAGLIFKACSSVDPGRNTNYHPLFPPTFYIYTAVHL